MQSETADFAPGFCSFAHTCCHMAILYRTMEREYANNAKLQNRDEVCCYGIVRHYSVQND